MALDKGLKARLQGHVLALNNLFMMYVEDRALKYLEDNNDGTLEMFRMKTREAVFAVIAFAELLRLTFEPTRAELRDLKKVAMSMSPGGEFSRSLTEQLRTTRNSDENLN